jgi:hypothetical protein
MTLADEILNHQGEMLRPFGCSVARACELLQQAQRFVFEPEAVEAVVNLIHSKPSSLFEAAAQFTRLPFDVCWIEWPTPDIAPLLSTQLRTKRTGALLHKVFRPETFSMITAWSYTKEALQQETSKLNDPVYKLDSIGMSELCAEVNFDLRAKPGGFQVKNLWEPPKDPRETTAAHALENRIGFYVQGEQHKDESCAEQSRRLTFENMTRFYGREFAESKLCDVAQEVKPVIGMLILLNSKNCVSTARVEPPPKLNKARVKRGALPFVSYTTVNINLGRRDARQASAYGVSAEEIRQHLVRGHFKIRKTGVYWWRNHIRGLAAAGAVEHSGYKVKA